MKPLKRIGIAPFPAKQQVRVRVERPCGVSDKGFTVGMKVYASADGKLIARKTPPKDRKFMGLVGVIIQEFGNSFPLVEMKL